jgi:hypothetical protein
MKLFVCFGGNCLWRNLNENENDHFHWLLLYFAAEAELGKDNNTSEVLELDIYSIWGVLGI